MAEKKPAPKKGNEGKTVTVRQIRSANRKPDIQAQTLRGLGLGKIRRTRTLEDQGDSFWWAGDDFFTMTDAYQPFEKVIRGFDPTHQGVRVNCVTASLDGGCGFGGSLVAAGISADGDIFEILES